MPDEQVEELTLEQLQGIETNPEDEKKVSESLQLPLGTYNSVPELVLKVSRAGEKAKHVGRQRARFYGAFVGTGDVASKHGNAGFYMSWEPRYNDEGKADLQTRLFNQASKVYRQAMGLPDGERVSVKDVLEFVQKYQVAVRFGIGDDDNIAFSISSAKE